MSIRVKENKSTIVQEYKSTREQDQHGAYLQSLLIKVDLDYSYIIFVFIEFNKFYLILV